MAAADQTLIVSTYGVIGSELHALSSTSWIATGYLTTLILHMSDKFANGECSDIFSRLPLFSLSMASCPTFSVGKNVSSSPTLSLDSGLYSAALRETSTN